MDKTQTSGAALDSGGKVAALAAEIRAAAHQPGRGGDDDQGGHEPSAGEHQAASEKQTYAPEDVIELLTLPAEAMYALTGKERWILGAREKEILAAKGARALELLIQIDPKKFIVGSFLLTFGTVYGTRVIAELKDRSRERKETKVSKV